MERLERQHLLIQRVYNGGFETLEPAERVEVMKAAGFDYWHYLKSPGAEKDCWPTGEGQTAGRESPEP